MKCSNCGKQIAEDSVFCNYCGQRIGFQAAAANKNDLNYEFDNDDIYSLREGGNVRSIKNTEEEKYTYEAEDGADYDGGDDEEPDEFGGDASEPEENASESVRPIRLG